MRELSFLSLFSVSFSFSLQNVNQAIDDPSFATDGFSIIKKGSKLSEVVCEWASNHRDHHHRVHFLFYVLPQGKNIQRLSNYQ